MIVATAPQAELKDDENTRTFVIWLSFSALHAPSEFLGVVIYPPSLSSVDEIFISLFNAVIAISI